MANIERSGWRDEGISNWHRRLGSGFPMTDIDWLVCEFSGVEPVAIIEYKNEGAPPINWKKWQYEALMELSRRANVPLFVVFYPSSYDWFLVTSGETKETVKFSESEYIGFLLDLRKRRYTT